MGVASKMLTHPHAGINIQMDFKLLEIKNFRVIIEDKFMELAVRELQRV